MSKSTRLNRKSFIDAIASQFPEVVATIDEIESACNQAGGVAPVPEGPRQQLESVGKILNIGWISRGAEKEASIICPRSSTCPRDKHCLGRAARQRLKPEIDRIREKVIDSMSA